MLLEFWTGSERVPSTFSQRILRRWQIVQVARDELPVSHCSQFGLLRATAIEGVGAAGVKTATLGRIDRARHIPFENDAPAPRAGLGRRDGGEQRLGIGMHGRGENALLRGELDDL